MYRVFMIFNIASKIYAFKLPWNEKSKMVYYVKELNEYFERHISLGVNKSTLENYKSEIRLDLQK